MLPSKTLPNMTADAIDDSQGMITQDELEEFERAAVARDNAKENVDTYGTRLDDRLDRKETVVTEHVPSNVDRKASGWTDSKLGLVDEIRRTPTSVTNEPTFAKKDIIGRNNDLDK